MTKPKIKAPFIMGKQLWMGGKQPASFKKNLEYLVNKIFARLCLYPMAQILIGKHSIIQLFAEIPQKLFVRVRKAKCFQTHHRLFLNN